MLHSGRSVCCITVLTTDLSMTMNEINLLSPLSTEVERRVEDHIEAQVAMILINWVVTLKKRGDFSIRE